jgi:hypothetical protein
MGPPTAPPPNDRGRERKTARISVPCQAEPAAQGLPLSLLFLTYGFHSAAAFARSIAGSASRPGSTGCMCHAPAG